MNQSVASDERRWMITLLLLTFTTGVVDAASVLGLGHVFTGNMTGNLLFLGFSLARAQDVSIGASLLAVAGFICGAAGGSRLVRASRACVVGFALELALLAVAAALAASDVHAPLRDHALLVLLACALGLQGAVARELRSGRVSTVVLTSTLISATADLSGDEATPQTLQRIAAIGAMLAGAVIGALLLRRGLTWPIGTAALVVAAALYLSPRTLAR
jgi:uncharacterized membrane protein YoaK (UPF0700 family)